MKLFRIVTRREVDDRSSSAPGTAWPDRPLRVLVTGATGYIGSAVTAELVGAGHEVTGMTRWAERTLDVGRLGARALVGDLRDPSTYHGVARSHDAVVHAALEPGAAAVRTDAAAIRTLLRALGPGAEAEDRPRMLVYTSGIYVLGSTGDAGADEDSPAENPLELVAWLSDHERMVLKGGSGALTTAVIRLGTVYGGRGGSIGHFFATAEKEGAARFIGDGRNRWCPIHIGDVATLYRTVIERRTSGVFHGVCDEAVPVGSIAEAASRAAGAGGATRSVPLDGARVRLAALADALVADQVVRAVRSREIGWAPDPRPFEERVGEAYAEWKQGIEDS